MTTNDRSFSSGYHSDDHHSVSEFNLTPTSSMYSSKYATTPGSPISSTSPITPSRTTFAAVLQSKLNGVNRGPDSQSISTSSYRASVHLESDGSDDGNSIEYPSLAKLMQHQKSISTKQNYQLRPLPAAVSSASLPAAGNASSQPYAGSPRSLLRPVAWRQPNRDKVIGFLKPCLWATLHHAHRDFVSATLLS